MGDRIDHAAEARRVLAEGEATITKLREAHGLGDTAAADAYGKKAAGCWAQAQVHATLALGEQQHIANLIAYLSHAEGVRGGMLHRDEGITTLDGDIREGLGL